MHISELLGKQVLDKNGNKVGKVSDIDINLPQWTINNLIVRENMLKKSQIELAIIDKVGDQIILKITRDELKKS